MADFVMGLCIGCALTVVGLFGILCIAVKWKHTSTIDLSDLSIITSKDCG